MTFAKSFKVKRLAGLGDEFYLGYTKDRAEGITFASVKDVKKKA